jgi:hypothetical protein
MRVICPILASFFIIHASGQTFKEKDVKTEINEVTVFLNGAQIFESGSVTIPAGKTTLKIRNLSPHLDEKSIQVKANGDFTILSVNHNNSKKTLTFSTR